MQGEPRIDDESPALEVSVVMPCLNEAETLAGCIREAQDALAQAALIGEIVIADNGSSDGSQAIAATSGARVISVAEPGYGSALRGGVEASRGEYIIMGDSDASYDFCHIPRFVARLRAGDDLVMGNRFGGGIQPGAMPWLHRYVGNPVLTAIGRLLFGAPIHDFHCGLRAFTKAAFRRMELTTTGMEFASEMVIKATLHQMRIGEIATVLRPDKRSRPPHLRPWRDGWRHLRVMLLYSPQWLYSASGRAAFLCGTLLLAALSFTPELAGSGVNSVPAISIAAALLATAGFQLMIIGSWARRVAAISGLIPASEPRDIKRHTTDRRILFGLGSFAAGLALLGLVPGPGNRAEPDFDQWQVTVRYVVPALTLMTFSVQAISAGFFSGLLDLAANQRRLACQSEHDRRPLS